MTQSAINRSVLILASFAFIFLSSGCHKKGYGRFGKPPKETEIIVEEGIELEVEEAEIIDEDEDMEVEAEKETIQPEKNEEKGEKKEPEKQPPKEEDKSTPACEAYKACCFAYMNAVSKVQDIPDTTMDAIKKSCEMTDEWKKSADGEEVCNQAMDALRQGVEALKALPDFEAPEACK